MDKQCDNCGSEASPFHAIHWDGTEEWEIYCDECYRKEFDPDCTCMTDAEINSILQL